MKSKNKKIKITLDLPIEILAELAIISASLDISVNAVAEMALRDYIKYIEREEDETI